MSALSLHCLASWLQLHLLRHKRLWAWMVQNNCHCHSRAKKTHKAMAGHISQCGKSITSHKWLENQSSNLQPNHPFVKLVIVVKFMGLYFAHGIQLYPLCMVSHKNRPCSDFMQSKGKMLPFFFISIFLYCCSLNSVSINERQKNEAWGM